ncbi:helix-turn-helix domain-containing protein [Aliikangiella sp. IMCC44359]|uniref:helix-turn-helix domain-containing protein n=1 Tax=Aliikangiella sp. IMCC44359 TaxID=3459125 RepID=UPI00403A7DF9
MILAEKIVRLRKQIGWSQEDLAEKMSVSRQSVSKWESTNSIPDLNKIIMLAEIFDVSTDYLLKDDVETSETSSNNLEVNTVQISLEQAMKYVDNKIAAAQLIAKGVFLCIGSTVPLFALLAMAETNLLNLTSSIATVIGIVFILVMVAIGVSFFIRTNQYESDTSPIENEEFELAYGVHSVFKEKLKKFRGIYNLRLSVGISMFIFCVVPLLAGSILSDGSEMILMMLIVTILMVAIGVYIVVPASAQYEAYSQILQENGFEISKSRRTKRAEKLAAFYWPLLTAIYIGWSLWTMDWQITWIVWPVGAILFAALVGLMELLDKEDM